MDVTEVGDDDEIAAGPLGVFVSAELMRATSLMRRMGR